MATRVRSSSPQSEPFPPLDPAPRTPTSVSSAPYIAPITIKESTHLLRPGGLESSLPLRATASASPKSVHGLSPRLPPRPLTGATALFEARRHKQQQQLQQQQQQTEGKTDSRHTSPNPAVTALSALQGAQGMSKPSDAPSPHNSTDSRRRTAVTDYLSVPVAGAAEASQPSPISVSSSGASEKTGPPSAMAMTATSNGTERVIPFVSEPGEISVTSEYPDSRGSYTTPGTGHSSIKAFSYPGPSPAESMGEGTSRGSPSTHTSSGTKRHKCPYCSTDFTRHHNLKSHLLTHSQEKPYVCQTCSARFRRLHDLKRHTKLHTGERPHTCDKCGRKFARGDALARHNKGPGGCAGRRSSFGGEDDGGEGRMDDDSMDVDYPGDYGNDDDGEEHEEQARRGSEPNRKRAHLETSQDAGRSVYRQHSSTYPPIAASRPPRNSMGPPGTVLASSGTTMSPGEMPAAASGSPAGGSTSSQYYSGGAPNIVYTQGGMTESPKPLSPGQTDQHRLSIAEATGIHRHRSPSLTQQFQQQHFGRGSGQATPPMPGAHVASQPAPQLPALPGLGSHPGRLPFQPVGPSMLQHQHAPPSGGPGSNPGSMSSHGQSSIGSMRDRDMTGESPQAQDIMAYVKGLEQRFFRMQDEYELRISRLQEDVITLKKQINPQSR